MARTNSTMLALDTPMPYFELPEVVSGKRISSGTFSGKKAMLVIFLCRHCPYVVHIKEELVKLGHDYLHADLGIVAISSNDVEYYPDDSPEGLRSMVEEWGLSYPLCFDETQETAKAFTAACTPDFFLFDKERRLVYRGQLDDSRPGNGKPVTGRDLRSAIEAVLDDRPVDGHQRPSAGCNIKWKPGNAPAYG